jgi:hypothetical protein
MPFTMTLAPDSGATFKIEKHNRILLDIFWMQGIHDWTGPSLDFEGEAGLAILVFLRVGGPLDRKSLAQ